MSGFNYLADTNTFIYLLNRHPALQNLLEVEWYFFFITEIELLGKTGISNAEVKKVQALLDTCTKIIHSEEINKLTIRIRREHKIKLPDALIAATALYTQLPLLTFDKGFTQIKSLDLVLLQP